MNLSQDEIPVEQITCTDTLGPALYKFSLAGNRMQTIPEPLIVKLTGLRELDFSQCGLNSVPEQWGLPSLKKLILSHNRIREFLSEVRNRLFVVLAKTIHLPLLDLFSSCYHRMFSKGFPNCSILICMETNSPP